MKNTREFTAKAVAGEFVITEVPTATWSTVSRELAWQTARTQILPTVFVALDGTRTELGDTWDLAAWEQAMYSGHISYELSMTDGYYAPEAKDQWLFLFRQAPNTKYNDASEDTKAALGRYLASR